MVDFRLHEIISFQGRWNLEPWQLVHPEDGNSSFKYRTAFWIKFDMEKG